MRKETRQNKRLRELYDSAIQVVRKYQQEREEMLARVEAAILGIESTKKVEVVQEKSDVVTPLGHNDIGYQRRLANERLERCRILWNALRLVVQQISMLKLSVGDEKLENVVLVILEGGPLGYQVDLKRGVDILGLSDLERASGAIKYVEGGDRTEVE